MFRKWTTQLTEMIKGPLPENRKRRDHPLTYAHEARSDAKRQNTNRYTRCEPEAAKNQKVTFRTGSFLKSAQEQTEAKLKKETKKRL